MYFFDSKKKKKKRLKHLSRLTFANLNIKSSMSINCDHKEKKINYSFKQDIA